MNKKGFTLVELLGVVIILAVLSLLAFPPIINQMKKTKNALSDSLKELVFSAANSLVDEHGDEFLKVNGYVYCVEVETLVKYNYLKEPVLDPSTGKELDLNTIIKASIENDMVNFEISDNCSRFAPEIVVGTVFSFAFTGSPEIFVAPEDGVYMLEVWGAQGGDKSPYLGGKGGYSQGNITLTKGQTLYAYVGSTQVNATPGYNGAGVANADQLPYGSGGGGGTDFRTIDGEWNNAASLSSRIIVAGGGGGAAKRGEGYGDGNGGYGGGLVGGNGETVNHTQNYGYGYGTGGTQSAGGTYKGFLDYAGYEGQDNVTGKFGYGVGVSGGGGGGYWGGGGHAHGGGGGGSSYIGGVTLAQTIPGNQSMPNPSGGYEVGHSGNGYARITFLGQNPTLNFGRRFEFTYLGSEQIFDVPQDGKYQIEAWGAQGGGKDGYIGGLGGYTKGTITLTEGKKLYLYVGGAGSTVGGYNGGGEAGNSGYGTGMYGVAGGGATDIRYFSGTPSSAQLLWNNIDGLRNRIMVAGGGGGSGNRTSGYGDGNGGYGGGLVGGPGLTNSTIPPSYEGSGGSQTAGGIAVNTELAETKAGFGYGAGAYSTFVGGGSGYYGGGAYAHGGGGGGSSFISGASGCNAINSSGVHTGTPNHFSGLIFSNTVMKSGNETFKSPLDLNETGHSGNGHIRITYLGS